MPDRRRVATPKEAHQFVWMLVDALEKEGLKQRRRKAFGDVMSFEGNVGFTNMGDLAEQIYEAIERGRQGKRPLERKVVGGEELILDPETGDLWWD